MTTTNSFVTHTFTLLAPVVQRVNNVRHQKNLYPEDSRSCWRTIIKLETSIIHLLNGWALERSGFSQVSYSYSLKTKAYYTIFQSEDNFTQSLAIKSALLFNVKKISTTKFVFKLIIKNKHSKYSFAREKRLKHKAKKIKEVTPSRIYAVHFGWRYVCAYGVP